MGVKDLTKIAKKYAPDALESKEYKDFAGETWAIDASIFFYRFCHDPTNKKPNPHIDGFYQLIFRLLSNGIKPIIVFDGKKPQQKLHTLKVRRKQREKNMDKVTGLQKELLDMMPGVSVVEVPSTASAAPADVSGQQMITLDTLVEMHKGTDLEDELKKKLEEVNKAKKNIIYFQPNTYQDVMNICELMGVRWLRANWEADALCTKLYQEGQVDAVMSEDSDILLYKGGRLIRKFNWSNTVEVVHLDKLLAGLKMTHDQFIDLCILSGTDYTVDTIGQMGSIRATGLIQKGMTIESIIAKIQQAYSKYMGVRGEDKDHDKKFRASLHKDLRPFFNYSLPDDLTDFDYQSARDLIKTAHGMEEDVDVSQPYDIGFFQFDEVKQLMTSKCNYQSATVDRHFKKLKEALDAPAPKVTEVPVKVQAKPKVLIPIKLKNDEKTKITLKKDKIKISLKS
jgi:flap endonuclease-1